MKYLILFLSVNCFADTLGSLKFSDLTKEKVVKIIKRESCVTKTTNGNIINDYQVILVKLLMDADIDTKKGDLIWMKTIEGYVQYQQAFHRCNGCDC